MKICILSILLAVSVSARDIVPPIPEIWDLPFANYCGESNLADLPQDYRKEWKPKCVDAFGDMFSKIKPLSSGYFGSVYLATSKNENNKIYILKAIELDHKSAFTNTLAFFQGINRVDEMKIGRELTTKVVEKGLSAAFMVTQDWFLCNLKAIISKFCEGKKCPDTKKMKAEKADTQFVIAEFIPGHSLFEFMSELPVRTNRLIDMTKFMKSLTFQVLLAMQQSFDAIKFSHFDMNFHNIRLQPEDAVEGDFFLFKAKDRTWRVPVTDSKKLRARIIDFGISKAEVPGPNGMRVKAGPSYTDAYNDMSSHQFSIFMFFYYMISSIPCETLTHWMKIDPEGYEQFAEVFDQAIGFYNNNPFLGVLSGIRPLSKTTRSPRRFGIPAVCQFLSNKAKVKLLEGRGLWAMVVTTVAGKKPFHNGEVTATSLLNMDFFKDYSYTAPEAKSPVPRSPLTRSASLPNMYNRG